MTQTATASLKAVQPLETIYQTLGLDYARSEQIADSARQLLERIPGNPAVEDGHVTVEAYEVDNAVFRILDAPQSANFNPVKLTLAKLSEEHFSYDRSKGSTSAHDLFGMLRRAGVTFWNAQANHDIREQDVLNVTSAALNSLNGDVKALKHLKASEKANLLRELALIIAVAQEASSYVPDNAMSMAFAKVQAGLNVPANPLPPLATKTPVFPKALGTPAKAAPITDHAAIRARIQARRAKNAQRTSQP